MATLLISPAQPLAARPGFVRKETDEDEMKYMGESDRADSIERVSSAAQPEKSVGIVDAFLGRDRTKLQKKTLVWNQGFPAFRSSLAERTKGIFTKRFLICLAAGQALAWSLTATSIFTTELGMNNWAMPTFQTFFLYFFLNLIYTPYTIYRYGFKSWGKMVWSDGWKYIFLAAVDVEANFLVVKAYGYSDLLSCQLLNAWATPACMIFAFFLCKARYHWTQVLGVLICIAGLGMTVASDAHEDKNYPAMNKTLGNILMLIGATGYGLSNSLEEFFVRRRPLYEVVGQLGLWGTIINGVQGAGLEHKLFTTVAWNGTTIGYLIGYTLAMLFLYTLAPILYRLSSSPFYNISILTSSFYGLCIGLTLFGYRPYWLYFLAFGFVLVGLVVYFSCARPEATATLDVVARGKQAEKETAAGKRNVVGDSRF